MFAFHLISDVEQGAGHAHRHAVVIAVEAGTAFQIARGAVGQLHAVGQLIVAGRAFTQAAVSVAHGVAFFAGHAFEELVEGLVEGLGVQTVQLGGPCRSVEHAAGNVPVPGAELRRVQCQVEAFLAVL
ncbi:hypothetical protein D3C81_965660 [compost metagenome]